MMKEKLEMAQLRGQFAET